MAKGQHLSNYQQKIVQRYYLHRDSIVLQRLQELVSELALDPTSASLWKRAKKALESVECEPPLPKAQVEQVLEQASVEGLAEIVNTLHAR